MSVLACEEGKGPDEAREVLRLISRKVPVARAFEDSRASLRQANQESSSGVVKRDRLSSINIEGRAVDSGTRERSSRLGKNHRGHPGPRRICAPAQLVVTFR